MQMMAANGQALHVMDRGPRDGRALVFANSLGTDFRTWARVIERLPASLRVVAYDKRGHGLSSAPPAPYSLDDHVGDLAALLDTLGIRAATVCGLSVGGMIAQGLAAARPELVAALVLCDTAHKIGETEGWNDRIAAVEAGGLEVIADRIMEIWFSAASRAERATELAGWRNMLVRTPVVGYVGTCAALRDADLTASTKALTVPTLCVCGAEDAATTPDTVRAMAELIAGAKFTLIDGAGHLPCIDAPEALTGAMIDFMKENGLV